MDARTQQRLAVLTHVLTGELTVTQAAAYVRLSRRQVDRLVKAYRLDGPAALVHGNTGRRPSNRLADGQRAELAKLATDDYAGFNPVHLAETLAEERPALAVSARTMRRVLAEAGIAPVRRRRPPRHRSRRERMARAGMLLQTDGSRHDWLEGRGPALTLIGAVDDATAELTGATFRAQEDAAGYFIVLSQTVARYGLPLALYSDRHGIFVKDPLRPPTLAEQLTGKRSLTQLGRALDELAINWIGAHSAPAKGRVERGWGTHQDRLAAELRRRRAATIDEANEVLTWYLPRHNRRFAVAPAEPEAAWRPWPDGPPPEAVFCFHYRRRVSNDSTIAWDGGELALPRRPAGASWPNQQVILQERLDGSLWVGDGDRQYQLSPAPPSAPLLRARGLDRQIELAQQLPSVPVPEPPADDQRSPSAASTRRPASDHPWRRYPAVRHRPR